MERLPITLQNYQEYIMLYLDNELNVQQRKDVQDFIAANPSLADEWAEWEAALLEPESISFPHKASLYRIDEQAKVTLPRSGGSSSAKLFHIGWMSAAAVAVLLLMWFYPKENGETTSGPEIKTLVQKNHKPVNSNHIHPIDITTAQSSDKEKKSNEPVTKQTVTRKTEKQPEMMTAKMETGKQPAPIIQHQESSFPMASSELVVNQTPTTLDPAAPANIISTPNDATQTTGFSVTQYKNDYATEALYTESLQSPGKAVKPATGRKHTLRQFTRQVGNIYQRITHPVINKPAGRIGNLEISL